MRRRRGGEPRGSERRKERERKRKNERTHVDLNTQVISSRVTHLGGFSLVIYQPSIRCSTALSISSLLDKEEEEEEEEDMITSF